VYSIVKRFTFEAGHRLMNYDGDCGRLHGHSYVVEAELLDHRLDGVGFVVDFNELKASVRRWIDQTFDHKFLVRFDDPLVHAPEVAHPSELCVMEQNPTAENIAELIRKWIVDWAHDTHPSVVVGTVVVHETATGRAACS